MNRVEEAKIRTALEHGAMTYSQTPSGRRFYDCDANVGLVADEILRRQLPPQDATSWAAVVEDPEFAPRLAKRGSATPEVRAPEKEEWKYPFPEFHTVSELKRIPPKVYRDFWFDKSRGELTQRALDFRAQVEKVLAEANEKRSR